MNTRTLGPSNSDPPFPPSQDLNLRFGCSLRGKSRAYTVPVTLQRPADSLQTPRRTCDLQRSRRNTCKLAESCGLCAPLATRILDDRRRLPCSFLPPGCYKTAGPLLCALSRVYHDLARPSQGHPTRTSNSCCTPPFQSGLAIQRLSAWVLSAFRG